MKNAIVLPMIFMLAFFSACSKSPGKTSSKIQIVSGNFAALLTNKANNGLFFYGRSNDGKVFTKKVDTDTIDLVFPNGTWNFFAVSYELGVAPAAGTLPNFTGKTYCGRTTANLNGTDASIQINLTNDGCNDPAFSNQTVYTAGEYKLPFFNFINCKSLANANFYTSCDNNPSTGFNKGYATSYRLIVMEGKNFGDPIAPVKIAESPCIRTTYTNQSGIPADPTSAFSIPTNFGAGFNIAVEVFYGGGAPLSATACDGSKGVDIIPLIDGPRMKIGMDVSTTPRNALLFVRTNNVDVCSGIRLFSSGFASGMGFPGSPLTACTKDQLNLLRTNFATYKESSIDLLTDIDYGMASVPPIGDALLSSGGSATNEYGKGATAYTPVFNGNGHKISNLMMDCKTAGGTASNNDIGFFRRVGNASIQNLTFNNAVIFCDGGANIGIVAGKVINTAVTSFENIRIHGHAEGNQYVGGLIGFHDGTSVGALNVKNVHVKGDWGATSYLGGLIGFTSSSATSTMNQSSFKGSLSGNHNNNGSVATNTFVGGLIGYSTTVSGTMDISEVVVNAGRIEGSMYNGGLIGKAINTNISDAYSQALLRSSSTTDGSVTFTRTGGAIGYASSVNLTNVLALQTLKSTNRGASDHTSGGLIGDATTTSCSNSYYDNADASTDGFACGTELDYTQTRTRANYIGLKIPYEFAQWDAGALPAQYASNVPTCSPSDDGRFITVTTPQVSTVGFGSVLPGDILLCNGSANVLITSLNVPTTLSSTPYLWRMPDDGYDIPRLAFEEKAETFVPYLTRPCSGKYTTQAGAGSELDPKWICSPGQFAAMDTTNFYALKKDIYFPTASGSYTPKAAGVYKLDGNGNALHNYVYGFSSTITGNLNAGIFANLQSGSIVKNLRIVNSSMTANTVNTAGPSIIKAGLLTGLNEGVLQNISIEFSNVKIAGLTLTSTDAFYLGGAVGVNSGSINKMDVDAFVSIEQGSYPFGSLLVAGGVAGVNSNSIIAARTHSSMERFLNCPGSGNIGFADTEYLGTFAGYNNSTGSIREISSEGEFRASFLSGTCQFVYSGHISPFIAKNEGVVADFEVEPKIFLQNTVAPWHFLFDYNNGTSASVSRGIVKIDSQTPNGLFNQTLTQGGTWDAGLDGPGTSLGTCSLADSGKWFDISNGNGSSAFGAVTTADRMVCNGAAWRVIPSLLQTQIFIKPMTDVLYLVRNQSTPPLAAGRYLDDSLTFSIPSAGTLSVMQAGTSISNFVGTGWAVGTNFFNQGTSAWMLPLFNGATSSTKVPEVSKVHGNLENLGPAF